MKILSSIKIIHQLLPTVITVNGLLAIEDRGLLNGHANHMKTQDPIGNGLIVWGQFNFFKKKIVFQIGQSSCTSRKFSVSPSSEFTLRSEIHNPNKGYLQDNLLNVQLSPQNLNSPKGWVLDSDQAWLLSQMRHFRGSPLYRSPSSKLSQKSCSKKVIGEEAWSGK